MTTETYEHCCRTFGYYEQLDKIKFNKIQQKVIGLMDNESPVERGEIGILDEIVCLLHDGGRN